MVSTSTDQVRKHVQLELCSDYEEFAAKQKEYSQNLSSKQNELYQTQETLNNLKSQHEKVKLQNNINRITIKE